jgi:hypothetical protein
MKNRRNDFLVKPNLRKKPCRKTVPENRAGKPCRKKRAAMFKETGIQRYDP